MNQAKFIVEIGVGLQIDFDGFLPRKIPRRESPSCFRGNEKGSVENSVKVLLGRIFSGTYRFGNLNEAREYPHGQLLKLNEGSEIEDEKKCLAPGKLPLELAVISDNKVNTSSMNFRVTEFCVN
ncbi:MAG: hypothetical protein LBK41_04470 [Clostridiales bacterium]|nr:hypothetical protein [Clostridiales bacterium]